MTSRDVLRSLLRRWYLVMLGAGLSVFALWLCLDRPGVYWTEFNIVLLAPTYEFYPNQLEDPYEALAPMAGVLVTEWNQDRRPLRMASTDTTVFGEGLRRGVRLRLPNNGSQWLPAYTTPSIQVQIVDDDPVRVSEEARRVRAEVDALLERRQASAGIVPSMRVTAMAAPDDPTVSYVAGSRVRTMGAVGLVGASLTLVGTYWIDRWLSRRGRPSGSAGTAAHRRRGPVSPGNVEEADAGGKALERV